MLCHNGFVNSIGFYLQPAFLNALKKRATVGPYAAPRIFKTEWPVGWGVALRGGVPGGATGAAMTMARHVERRLWWRVLVVMAGAGGGDGEA